MSRPLIKVPWCWACRRGLLQSFVASSGVSIPGPFANPLQFGSKSFSIQSPPRKDKSSSLDSDDTPSESLIAVTEGCGKDGSPEARHPPWYLQIETPTLASHLPPNQQRIPDLPENPPVILKDLLHRLSVDIGLDDLTLLDLRERDPPPALGGNLIMIIGTARGLKHLNVSADRFCRWLRSTFKLRPSADGLLGRNELKIKLRRKARRARIASGAGINLPPSDDGISTGWICVNIGTVKDDISGQMHKLGERGFEGFGEVVRGTQIVVQMAIEEKRAELDLEGLWGAVPKRGGQERRIPSQLATDAQLQKVHDSPVLSKEMMYSD